MKPGSKATSNAGYDTSVVYILTCNLDKFCNPLSLDSQGTFHSMIAFLFGTLAS